MNKPFIEVHCAQTCKKGQVVYGDTFSSRKLKDENRIISVLSDGLGSGVKANVLSTLTATMALNYTSNHFDIQKTANTIMKTLPVCKTRKISYATFSIVDIQQNKQIEVVEYDNPPFILIRGEQIIDMPKETLPIQWNSGHVSDLKFTSFAPLPGDRLLFFSDGVTQSGMGRKDMPLGWGMSALKDQVKEIIHQHPGISAKALSQNIVKQAGRNDHYHAKDDISCAAIYIREPRKLLIVTGPPFDENKDKELVNRVQTFEGSKIICGGTTANILSRGLNQRVVVDLKNFDAKIPPTSSMKGVDLVTEGTLTIGRVAELLESDINPECLPVNGATQILKKLLNSDEIHFIVGTKINEAHQDPNLPVELDIRRNIIKKIKHILEEKHLKETRLQFI